MIAWYIKAFQVVRMVYTSARQQPRQNMIEEVIDRTFHKPFAISN